jgi:hypothetical protein
MYIFIFSPKVEKKAAQQMVREERRETKLQKVTHRQLKFAELQEEETGEQMARRVQKAKAKQSLEDRLASEAQEGSVMRTETGHTFTFKTEKSR